MINTDKIAQEKMLRAAKKQREKFAEVLQVLVSLQERVIVLEKKLGIVDEEQKEPSETPVSEDSPVENTEASIDVLDDVDAEDSESVADIDFEKAAP